MSKAKKFFDKLNKAGADLKKADDTMHKGKKEMIRKLKKGDILGAAGTSIAHQVEAVTDLFFPGLKDTPNGLTGKSLNDILKWMKQHPEWYKHSIDGTSIDTYQMLGMNYAVNKTSLVDETSVPYISVADTVLTLGHYVDDDSRTSMVPVVLEAILRDLTSKSGRVSSDSPGLLGQYIYDVRTVLAVLMQVIRAYEVANEFRTLDASMPNAVVFALGYDPKSFREEAAAIRSTIAIWLKQLFTAVPVLDLDLYRRTAWMYGSLFIDAKCNKPTYMAYRVPHVHMYTSGAPVQVCEDLGTVGTREVLRSNYSGGVTWAQISNRVTGMIDDLVVRYGVANNQFTSDILRVYGTSYNSMLYKELLARVATDQPRAIIISDDYQRTQWMNMRPLCGWWMANAANNAEWRCTVSTNTIDGANITFLPGMVTPSVEANAIPTFAVTPNIFSASFLFNNWMTYTNPYEEILAPEVYRDPAMQISITRLAPTVKVDDNKAFVRKQAGTEVVLSVATIGRFPQITTGSECPSTSVRVYPGAGFVAAFDAGQPNSTSPTWPISFAASAHSMVDWQAKMILGSYGSQGETTSYYGKGVLVDYTLWAKPTDDQLGDYHMVANQSLLTPLSYNNESDFTESFIMG